MEETKPENGYREWRCLPIFLYFTVMCYIWKKYRNYSIHVFNVCVCVCKIEQRWERGLVLLTIRTWNLYCVEYLLSSWPSWKNMATAEETFQLRVMNKNHHQLHLSTSSCLRTFTLASMVLKVFKRKWMDIMATCVIIILALSHIQMSHSWIKIYNVCVTNVDIHTYIVHEKARSYIIIWKWALKRPVLIGHPRIPLATP